ncbi:nuclease-related domain-containing protein [Halobacillus sp. A5]|uniref:nuclease-related domain-containing protein n=1 Tax=Halobacillus sp. A5 TaxID=2880263 RepID=UPI0035327481|nr:NERD domain-containing protein [Halobacillus sp. A5]
MEEYVNCRSTGANDEDFLRYCLTHFPQTESFSIFHDVRLPLLNDVVVQIDALILSRSCILILEAKNLEGKKYF